MQNFKPTSAPKQVCRDSLFNGAVSCLQHRPGYRFSVDSVILAQFPKIAGNETILDLGTGCGIIGLILCYRYRTLPISITGIELQDELAELACANIEENGYSDRFRLIHADARGYRELFEPESFSLVVSNPPFYIGGSGRTSHDEQSSAARHQDDFGLEGFVEAASFCVKNRGRVVFIYPADLSMHLIEQLQRRRLTPKSVQYVYSYPESDAAALFVVESVKNGGIGCRVRSPFYLYRHRNGPYSDHAESLFAP